MKLNKSKEAMKFIPLEFVLTAWEAYVKKSGVEFIMPKYRKTYIHIMYHVWHYMVFIYISLTRNSFPIHIEYRHLLRWKQTLNIWTWHCVAKTFFSIIIFILCTLKYNVRKNEFIKNIHTTNKNEWIKI